MIKRIHFFALLGAFAASMMTVAPAEARNVTADIAQINELMKRDGYTVEVKTEGGESHLTASRGKDSYSFEVFFYGCDEKTMKNCKSVQFGCGFTPKTKPTLAAMNDYARDNRWGRIYLDKEGDPIIEMDVDLEKGGMSEALFLDNLEYFEAVVDRFGEFVFTGKMPD
jgi:hypothetical protein